MREMAASRIVGGRVVRVRMERRNVFLRHFGLVCVVMVFWGLGVETEISLVVLRRVWGVRIAVCRV